MISIPTHSVRRPHGTILINDPDAGREIQLDTLQCVHCQECWIVHPGSGKQRGFCLKCNGPICGPKCCDCLGPIEARIALYEKGKLASL